MKVAIRMFALFVAFAGLVSASFSPAATKAISTHASMTATGPGPTIGIPAPLPCTSDGTCFASFSSAQ
ncbi:MAG: hypothetical protein WBC92_16920 [Terracidiphilus sp.]